MALAGFSIAKAQCPKRLRIAESYLEVELKLKPDLVAETNNLPPQGRRQSQTPETVKPGPGILYQVAAAVSPFENAKFRLVFKIAPGGGGLIQKGQHFPAAV